MLKEIIVLSSLVIGGIYYCVDTQIMPYTEEWRQECANRVYEGWEVCKTITPERYNEIIERTEQAVKRREQREEQHDQELQQIVELINENPRQGLIKMVNAIECSSEAKTVLYSFEYNYESNHNLGVLTGETYELENGYWVRIIYCRNGDRIVAVSDSYYGDSFVSRRF